MNLYLKYFYGFVMWNLNEGTVMQIRKIEKNICGLHKTYSEN